MCLVHSHGYYFFRLRDVWVAVLYKMGTKGLIRKRGPLFSRFRESVFRVVAVWKLRRYKRF